MITFNLTRDESRTIGEDQVKNPCWLSSMRLMAETMMINNAGKDAYWLNSMIAVSLLEDLQLVFKRKLLTRSKEFKFTISYAHGVIFYVYLLHHPIPKHLVWERTRRQRLCDLIHQQLFAMRPPVHENVPLTLEDFYQDFLIDDHEESQ